MDNPTDSTTKGWIGVDLDGTLAYSDGWDGSTRIGAPISTMVERVKTWLADGQDVRIVTARVSGSDPKEYCDMVLAIQDWCVIHLGKCLPVTNRKDLGMIELWDDRAIQVIRNKGLTIDEFYQGEEKYD